MRKRVVRIWDLPSSGAFAASLILGISFFLGGLAGCLFANQVDGNGSAALREYLEGYLRFVSSGEMARPDVLSLLWETVRWPLAAIALGLTPLGLLGIPILFMVRGFLLSFSISSFFLVMGVPGLTLAFVIFGIAGLVCVPVLFVLGVQGFLSAGTIVGRLTGENRRQPLFDRIFWVRCGICAAALCVSFFLEYGVVPALLESLAEFLLAK